MHKKKILIIDDKLNDLENFKRKISNAWSNFLNVNKSLKNEFSLEITIIEFNQYINEHISYQDDIKKKLESVKNYDLVLLDINGIGDYSGLNFIKKLIEIEKNNISNITPKIVFLSDYTADDHTINRVLTSYSTAIDGKIDKQMLSNEQFVLKELAKKLFINDEKISNAIYTHIGETKIVHDFIWKIGSEKLDMEKILFIKSGHIYRLDREGNEQFFPYATGFSEFNKKEIGKFLIPLYELNDYNFNKFSVTIAEYYQGDKKQFFAYFQKIVINLRQVREFKKEDKKKIAAILQQPIPKNDLISKVVRTFKIPITQTNKLVFSYGKFSSLDIENAVDELNKLKDEVQQHYQNYSENLK